MTKIFLLVFLSAICGCGSACEDPTDIVGIYEPDLKEQNDTNPSAEIEREFPEFASTSTVIQVTVPPDRKSIVIEYEMNGQILESTHRLD